MAPTEHAKISPSASAAWTVCYGYPAVTAVYEDTASEPALRGTLAHKVLENCLNNGFDAKDFIASKARGTEAFNQEDSEAVQMAVDWIREEIGDADSEEVGVEVKLRYNADFWGTADFVRYRYSDQELLVVDYKHGSGVAVDAIDNPQGISYALMKIKALGNRGVARVRFVIIQPRGFHADGPIREFVVEGVDMLEWEDKIVGALTNVIQACEEHGKIDPDEWWKKWLHSGPHCRKNFCDHAAHCPRLMDDTTKALEIDFAPVNGAFPTTYDVNNLAKALGLVDRVKGWAKAVDEIAYAEAERGVTIPGYKLVKKRATASFRDPAEVVAAMELQGFDKSETHEPAVLKSPAQLREVLAPLMPGKTKKARVAAAKESLDEFTQYVSSGHTLVPVDDPRAPVRGDAADDFDAVE